MGPPTESEDRPREQPDARQRLRPVACALPRLLLQAAGEREGKMNRSIAHTLTAMIMVLIAGLALVAGCSSDRSLAPPIDKPSSGEPEFARILGSTGPHAIAQGALLGAKVAQSQPTGFPIDGSVGGTVQVGRYTLVFPPGAFLGTQTITVSESLAPYVGCKLGPEGLQFKVPVTLKMNLQGSSIDDAAATIFWLNNAMGGGTTWVNIGGSYDAQNHTVVTLLAHFSEYRGGRAGW
jgi:hypothetical protein